MPTQFEFSVSPPEHLDRPALWFLFQDNRLLVKNSIDIAEVPSLLSPADLGLTLIRQEYLGYLTDGSTISHCFSGEVAGNIALPEGMSFENLRALYPLLDEAIFWIAGRAVQVVEWDRIHQFCGQCGHLTANHPQDRAKVCPSCGLTTYPQIAPAIIVRVTRNAETESKILLARAQRFPPSMFSVLAGFVEIGETLEECVQREIREEVGITVQNIRYFGSQPWPFPHSLMIAFTAEYQDGDLINDPAEIVEAGWFGPDDLPHIPQPPSIANRLITAWLNEYSSRQP